MPSLQSQALLCLSCSITSLAAVELAPSLDLGGHVRGVANAEVREANSPAREPGGDSDGSQTGLGFRAESLLWLGYSGERWRGRIDLFASTDPEWDEPTETLLLEQAYAEFDFDAGVVRAGRFRNTWFGWEAHHADGLFRVRHSAAWDWNVQNHALQPNRPFLSEGVSLRTPDGRAWQAEFLVVDTIFSDGELSRSSDLGVGVSLRYVEAGLGMIHLGLAWDPNSTSGENGEPVDTWGIDLNGHYTGLEDIGWFFAFQAQFHRHPELEVAGTRFGDDFILLGLARYQIEEDWASSLMINWVERGFDADDNEVLEIALALNHVPQPRTRVDVEVYYQAESADRADSYGLAAALTVVLP